MAAKKGGRPTTFTQDMADIICERLADGESLRAICDDKDIPAKSTIFQWLNKQQEFADQYARAKEEQADTIFDEILDIADDGRNDWMKRHDSDGNAIGWQENGEALRRSQLRIDARKWMAGKLKAKKYGDKQQMELTGKDGGDIRVIQRIERKIVNSNNSNS